MKGFESRSVLLVIISMVCIFSSSAICAPAGYVKIWEDTFDGTSLDTANWHVGCEEDPSGDLIPGAKGDGLLNYKCDAYITDEDVWVSGGNLYLQNQQRSYTGTDPAGTYDYTTGWILWVQPDYIYTLPPPVSRVCVGSTSIASPTNQRFSMMFFLRLL